ncbi:hypothetical protein N1851_034165 [Merluccius polli]|uniref:Uncharacterized protein n=1 Tax=Merluccius polli TaxID=89951 RepID=A0AA47M033_MERPO|nr:hypothetical protein N1851_034165 [Merluccius polli]
MQYVTDLRLKSQSCNFKMLCDSMIKDQIVIGVQDNRTDLTIEKAIQICQASESAKVQIKIFCNDENEEVGVVQHAKRQSPGSRAGTVRGVATGTCQNSAQLSGRTAENAGERITSLNAVSPREKCSWKS